MMEISQMEFPWEKEEDDELENGLVARRKNLNQSPHSTIINAGITNHHHQQHDEDEEEVKEKIQQNDTKVDEDEDENEKQHISEFCVYYDTDKGYGNVKSAHGIISVELVSLIIISILGTGKSHVPENTDIKSNNEENEIIKQNGEHQKHEMSFEGDISATSYIDNKLKISGIEVINDEITEYDVETVLKKQDTHDLFCPNCNSCITKRVILRKRKRRNREDTKRSKPQTPDSAESIVVLNENQAPNGVDSRLDDLQPPTSNENDYQREPDVFRCLSCFSIFMPTGDGFRLFRMFGNKSNEGNIDNSHNVKKNWFSKFLRSEKNVTNLNNSGAVESLDGKINVNVGGVSSNLNSSMQVSNSGTSNGTLDLEKNQIHSGTVTRESNGEMETESTLSDTLEPLLMSYHIEKESNKSEYPGFHEKERTNLSFSPPASKLGQLNSGGQLNSQRLASDGKEQKMDKDSDAILEVSQHIVHNNVEIHLEEPLKVNKDILTEKEINTLANVKKIESINRKDVIITIESKQLDASVFQRAPDTPNATVTPAFQQAVEQGSVTMATRGGRSLDIIKSIVYGGLIELIASLSVVSSAAGGDAATLNVLALGLANIFGGLFVISHDLWDLKNERTRKKEDRYQQLLGQRANFPIHMAVALLSYLIFGFLPPIVYGFSFHEGNDKNLKLLMVAATSIVFIMILAAGKAYVQTSRKSYFTTIGYHVVLGIMVSGVSYVIGGLVVKLLEKMDVFDVGTFDNLRIYGASSKPALATL